MSAKQQATTFANLRPTWVMYVPTSIVTPLARSSSCSSITQANLNDDFPIWCDSFSNLCICCFDTKSSLNSRCPIKVDLPASTWPTTTKFSNGFASFSFSKFSSCNKVLTIRLFQSYVFAQTFKVAATRSLSSLFVTSEIVSSFFDFPIEAASDPRGAADDLGEVVWTFSTSGVSKYCKFYPSVCTPHSKRNRKER